jgi:hypothetical protein
MGARRGRRRMRPPNLAETTADLIRRLDSLVMRMDEEQAQHSERLALLRQSVNGMVYAGMLPVGASDSAHLDFTVPFASVAVADPFGLGWFTVSTDGAGEGGASLGSIVVPQFGAVCVPLAGRSIDLSEATGAGSVFIAVYTRIQPFFYNPGSSGFSEIS